MGRHAGIHLAETPACMLDANKRTSGGRQVAIAFVTVCGHVWFVVFCTAWCEELHYLYLSGSATS
jgi:hypothetical protein